MTKHRIVSDGTRLPVNVDTTSNGGFAPVAIASPASGSHASRFARGAVAR